MNWLDIVIAIIILVPTVIGLRSGIIKAVFLLAGLAAGVVLAGQFSQALAGALKFIQNAEAARIAAFIIIVLAVLIIALIIGTLVKWTASMLMLGWLNHLGGAVLGFLAGVVVCGALLAIWVKFAGLSTPVADSSLARILLARFPLVLALLPREFDSIRSFFK